MWSKNEIKDWYKELPYLCGFNYIPSCAVNWSEFWQDYNFNEKRIEFELSVAKELGYNFIRTNLQYLLWLESREEFYRNLNKFLSICERLEFKVMLCPMDDCGFSGDEPYLGKQEEPIENIHNSQAAASPGRQTVMNLEKWCLIEKYIKELITVYNHDKTIIVWDLYNEPSSNGIFKTSNNHFTHQFDERLKYYSYHLMIKSFEWAREAKATQPLTVAAWQLDRNSPLQYYNNAICSTALILSDIISFHAYIDNNTLVQIIKQLRFYGRPIICSEWMARCNKSTIIKQLPIFKKENIACTQWGLFKGKTQTYLPWNGIRENLTPEMDKVWFHDIMYEDATPYIQEEVDFLKKTLK